VADDRPRGDELWAPATSTGVGSLPGTDPAEAARFVLGETGLPYLPELPARGTGAGMTGRSLMLLDGLSADLQPSGWRLVPRSGVDARRARDLLARDLDAFTVAAEGYTGPLKVQAAGPWTLAATTELPRGDKVLRDHGACRDLADSLAAGLASHVRDLRGRIPGATSVLVQLDEPMLPAVRDGRVATASGFATLRRPELPELDDLLARVFRVLDRDGGVPGVHACAPRFPVALVRGAGARWLSLDVTLTQEEDEVGEAVEAGMGLVAGLVAATDPPEGQRLPSVDATLEPLRKLWERIGLPVAGLAAVAISPTCGLAGATPAHARAATVRSREAASELAEVAA
jgi:hypothetical protein